MTYLRRFCCMADRNDMPNKKPLLIRLRIKEWFVFYELRFPVVANIPDIIFWDFLHCAGIP